MLDVGLEPGVVADVLQDVQTAIKTIEWPPGSGSFTLRDEPGKKRGQGNGVKPIKDRCLRKLESLGWQREVRVEVTGLESRSGRRGARPGPVDAAKSTPAGLLILPTRQMYKYLTDRVGNFPELEPYFPLWQSLRVTRGFLAVIAVEHDGVSKEVPRIPKGTNGRALGD